MREIRQPIRTFLNSPRRAQPTEASVARVRKDRGMRVDTYPGLVKKVAELAFINPEFVLLFRGQVKDHRENDKSTLFPSMFRLDHGRGLSENATQKKTRIDGYPLQQRYDQLEQMEGALVQDYFRRYQDRFSRSRILRWTILQHYEVCATPLLDLTHSLRVATSFAFSYSKDARADPYLFVLGLPQISGAITVVSDQNLQIIRLSSVCPPEALRPHFQEAYFAGTFPTLDAMDQKMHYRRSEVDGANRLIAKFRLAKSGFWPAPYKPLSKKELLPPETSQAFNDLQYIREH